MNYAELLAAHDQLQGDFQRVNTHRQNLLTQSKDWGRERDQLVDQLRASKETTAAVRETLTSYVVRVETLERELYQSQQDHAAQPYSGRDAALEPVAGDVLPQIGSDVLIRHGRDDGDHLCTVTGYYAWPDLGGNKSLHRVFVRMAYKGTNIEQARLLSDIVAMAAQQGEKGGA